jgi:hypothetical protein
MKDKHHSEETKKKISEARKRYWKMRREKQCGKKF